MPLQNFPPRAVNRRVHVRKKIFRRPVRRVRRGEQPAARLQHGERGGDQRAKIFFRTESAVFLRLRKRRRIEHDGVECAAFLRQPPQPVNGVAINKIVLRWINPIQNKIAFAPFQIFFREIKARRPRARLGRADREAAGVGKAIQDFRFPLSNLKSGKSAAMWPVKKRRRLSR